MRCETELAGARSSQMCRQVLKSQCLCPPEHARVRSLGRPSGSTCVVIPVDSATVSSVRIKPRHRGLIRSPVVEWWACRQQSSPHCVFTKLTRITLSHNDIPPARPPGQANSDDLTYPCSRPRHLRCESRARRRKPRVHQRLGVRLLPLLSANIRHNKLSRDQTSPILGCGNSDRI